jgi:rRNA maturation protein Nop10
MVHILKCVACASYGLGEVCTCGAKRQKVAPAKFSPEDKYANYRRQAKEESSR